MLCAIVLAGVPFRTCGLAARSVWFDEAFTWRLIQFPFIEMLQRAARDNSPPLYYILLQGWAELFGTSATALRALSVLFGSLTVVGAYLFGAEAFAIPTTVAESAYSSCRGRAVGLLAAALVALSAFQIRYSWELRMYALAAALTVFSSWALLRALRSPARLRRWLLYGVLALLLAYTHYYGLFTLAAQGLFVAGALLVRAGWCPAALLRERAFWYAVLTAGLVVVAWLPWLPVFLRQHAQVKANFWSPSPTWWDVADLWYRMFFFPEYASPPSRQAVLWAVDACAVALYVLGRKAGTGEWFVLCAGVGPLALCLFASWLDVSPLTLRYGIMAHVVLLVGLAALICRPRLLPERLLAGLTVFTLFVGVDLDFWKAMDLARRPGARGAAEFLAQRRRPGEPVVTCMPFFYFPLLYYAPDRSGYWLYTNGQPMPHHYGTAAMTPDDLITDEGLTAIHARRVWVVEMAGGFLDVHSVPVPRHWLAKGSWTFTDVFGLGDLILIEYDTTGKPAGAKEEATTHVGLTATPGTAAAASSFPSGAVAGIRAASRPRRNKPTSA
jgi:hypothetical protein